MKPNLKYLLIIIPLLLLFVCLKIERPKYQNDPEYAYLLNSVNNANLLAAGHIDHPGTTMQLAGAFILRTYHLFDFSEKEDLQTAVIKDPDRHIGVLNLTYIFLNFILFVFLGFVVYRYSKNIWLSIIVQLTPFYSGIMIELLATKVTPELFLSIAGVMLLALIIKFYYNTNPTSKKTILLFSLVSGFGIATKINFIPLILIPLIILPTIRNKTFYLLGTILSFVLFTIPIIAQYGTFYHWVLGLLTHKGLFGQGEAGFTDAGTYIFNLKFLLKAAPFFFVILGISLLLIITSFILNFFQKKKITLDLKILTAIIIAQTINILIVAKHMKGYYLFPSLCLTGGNFFFILIGLKRISTDLTLKFKWQIQSFTILIALATSIYITPLIKLYIRNYKQNRTEYEFCSNLIQISYPDYTIIYTIPFSYNKYSAYFFAKDYDRQKNLPKIINLYPDTYFWDTRWNQFYDWIGKTNFKDLKIKDRNKIILFGAQFDEAALNSFPNLEFKLNSVYHGSSYVIYEIISYKENPKNIELLCDAETLTNDGKDFSTSVESITFGNGNTQSNEKSHSKKFSIKLNASKPYGMTYRVKNAKKGDNFNISVWRYPEDNKGQIVVSSSDSKEFYTSGGFIINKENNGWQQIEVKFTLEVELKDKILDIYLLNDSQNDIYFDDLKIIQN